MYVSHYCSSNHPASFSSTLLDSIYRSFDLGEEAGMGIYRQPIDKIRIPSDEEIANFQRVCMIEKLMDKNNKGVSRRKMAEATKHGGSFSFSFSSSSDSSSGGGEAHEEISFPGAPLRRPKPIRTGGSGHHHKEKTRENHRLDFEMNRRERRGLADHQSEAKPKHEGGFLKTKSRALKIYADLKKVKQPISPGRKLATFINSLFTTAAGSTKKHKSDSNNPHHSPAASKSANTSTCSSASSFSRSCLSKPPSSSPGKFPSSGKRSVKFFPGSVIADEDFQPCGRKALHQETKPLNATLYSELLKNKNVKSSIDEELKVHVMEYNRRVEDAAMDFLRKTHFKNRVFDEESEEEDEDDDMESCASSDLFELDNLSTIGVDQRYRKELPVYETTRADAKRV